MHLPLSAARVLARGVVRPLLSPRLPIRLRRRLIDASGRTIASPRGTRRTRYVLGGVPTVRVAVPGAVGPHQVLFLHGGGYATGSATSHRAFVAHLARAAGAPVHVAEYRLAPEHPHPAAVDDALAAYRALRSAGHEAQRIAVAGDSAGGGLAMSLLLRLRAAGDDLPGSVLLVSPWLDLDGSSPTIAANARTDAMLSPTFLRSAAADYRAGQDPPDLRPLEADLAGLPPVHVVAAAGEILLGDSDALVARLRAAGVHVTYDRRPGLFHDYVLFVGMLAEADATVTALGAAIRADCRARG